MAGTKIGGVKAARTNKAKTRIYLNGRIQEIEPGGIYKLIGAAGGKLAPGPFRADRELARRAGIKGGTISRRGPVKSAPKETFFIQDPKIDSNIIEPFQKPKFYQGWFKRSK